MSISSSKVTLKNRVKSPLPTCLSPGAPLAYTKARAFRRLVLPHVLRLAWGVGCDFLCALGHVAPRCTKGALFESKVQSKF